MLINFDKLNSLIILFLEFVTKNFLNIYIKKKK